MRKTILKISVIAVIIIAVLISVILLFGRVAGVESESVAGAAIVGQQSGISQEKCCTEEACAVKSRSAEDFYCSPAIEHKMIGPNPCMSIVEDDIPFPPDGGDLPSAIPSER